MEKPTDPVVREDQIRQVASKGPRVTLGRVQSRVRRVMHLQPTGTTLTICVIELLNGTYITGESACVSPANFNKELGERIAYENAVQKIWALEGYLLRERLHDGMGAEGFQQAYYPHV